MLSDSTRQVFAEKHVVNRDITKNKHNSISLLLSE